MVLELPPGRDLVAQASPGARPPQNRSQAIRRTFAPAFHAAISSSGTAFRLFTEIQGSHGVEPFAEYRPPLHGAGKASALGPRIQDSGTAAANATAPTRTEVVCG
ncbi:hypothetical protein GCM10009735_80260 [Actinomadura chokoriensis]